MKGKRKKSDMSVESHASSQSHATSSVLLPQYPPGPLPHIHSTRGAEGMTITSLYRAEAIIPRQSPLPTYLPDSDRRSFDAVSAEDHRHSKASSSHTATPIGPPIPPPQSQVNGAVSPSNPSPPARQPSNNADQNPELSPPTILTREKKQRACANCRKAKLKCIVDQGSSECIRCRSRKEKCVFYPRGHDEDWQQTMTQDVYAALNHLAELSRTVHYMFRHMIGQGIMPEPPFPAFRPYQPPERDLTAVLACSGYHSGGTSEEKKRKRHQDEQHSRRLSAPLHARQERVFSHHHRSPSIWNHQYAPISSNTIQTQSNRIFSSNIPSAQTPYPLHRSMTSETSPDRPHSEGSNLATPHTTNTSFHPPPLAPGLHTGTPVFAPLSSQLAPLIPHSAMSHTFTAHIVPQAAPANDVDSSPTSDRIRHPEHPAPGSIQHAIARNGVNEAAEPPSDAPAAIPENGPTVEALVLDTEGEEVYGSADGRATIITKNVVSPEVARRLVQYFHSSMSPHLFGYDLQLRKFPYLSDGPRSITPFILAVECLLASERITELYPFHSPLADAVLQMMVTSPAESWQTFQGSRKDRDEQICSVGDALRRETAEDALDWDPELGIGPEEIVGVCALSSFMSERDHAKTISVHAFSWAKGWANYMKAPATTFAEVTGLVTALRLPTKVEIARILLLAYVVAAQEVLQHGMIDTILPTDISAWTGTILPDSPQKANGTSDPHDVLLGFHARLLAHMIRWLIDRCGITRGDGALETRDAFVAAHKRLADRTNSFLEWWAEDLKLYAFPAETMQQISLDYLNARTLVNSVLASSLVDSPAEQALWERSKAVAVECALQVLKRCRAWTPAASLINLPHVYYRMIALAAVEVVEALIASEQRSIPQAACPTTVKEVMPIIARVSQNMSSRDVQHFHYSRITAYTLRQHVENLARFVNG